MFGLHQAFHDVSEANGQVRLIMADISAMGPKELSHLA